MTTGTFNRLVNLKAQAYDQIALNEQGSRNLANINQAIGQLSQQLAQEQAQEAAAQKAEAEKQANEKQGERQA